MEKAEKKETTTIKKAKVVKVESIKKRLTNLITELKAPKSQRNNFGKYNYRSCEDILEAVKPLLIKHELHLGIQDEIKEIAGYIYIESTSIVSGTNEKDITDEVYKGIAQAGIDPSRKGMDIAQSFGSSSSYARKYSLNSIFLIDDTKDSDATNTHNKTQTPVKKIVDETTVTQMVENLNKEYNGEVMNIQFFQSKYSLNPTQLKKLKEVDNV